MRFVRDRFGDGLAAIEPRTFDCVYSISVLEHVDGDGLDAITRGMRQALLRPASRSTPSTTSIEGAAPRSTSSGCTRIVERFGGSSGELDETLARLSDDTETYYLSAESHNRWRGETPYDEFPMRVCVGVNVVSKRDELRPG